MVPEIALIVKNSIFVHIFVTNVTAKLGSIRAMMKAQHKNKVASPQSTEQNAGCHGNISKMRTIFFYILNVIR